MREPGQAKTWLEIKDVEAWIGNKRIFKNLNLNISIGENTAILGPNGSGKSCLLKLISRELYPLIQPKSRIKIFDKELVNIWELRSQIGFVSTGSLRNSRDEETLERFVLSGFYGAIRLGSSKHLHASQLKDVNELLQKLGLSSVAKERYGHISEGQKRLALIARALIHKPKVLILDEPTICLDLKAKFQLLDSLEKLCKEGITLLIITHHTDEIISQINRVVLLKEGNILEDGPVEDVINSTNLSNLFDIDLAVYKSRRYIHVAPK